MCLARGKARQGTNDRHDADRVIPFLFPFPLVFPLVRGFVPVPREDPFSETRTHEFLFLVVWLIGDVPAVSFLGYPA